MNYGRCRVAFEESVTGFVIERFVLDKDSRRWCY
jgi:hypothetical protein